MLAYKYFYSLNLLQIRYLKKFLSQEKLVARNMVDMVQLRDYFIKFPDYSQRKSAKPIISTVVGL